MDTSTVCAESTGGLLVPFSPLQLSSIVGGKSYCCSSLVFDIFNADRIKNLEEKYYRHTTMCTCARGYVICCGKLLPLCGWCSHCAVITLAPGFSSLVEQPYGRVGQIGYKKTYARKKNVKI